MLFYALCQRSKAFVYGKINSKILRSKGAEDEVIDASGSFLGAGKITLSLKAVDDNKTYN